MKHCKNLQALDCTVISSTQPNEIRTFAATKLQSLTIGFDRISYFEKMEDDGEAYFLDQLLPKLPFLKSLSFKNRKQHLSLSSIGALKELCKLRLEFATYQYNCFTRVSELELFIEDPEQLISPLKLCNQLSSLSLIDLYGSSSMYECFEEVYPKMKSIKINLDYKQVLGEFFLMLMQI